MKGKMLGKDIFLYLARYNKRANREMFQVLAKLTERPGAGIPVPGLVRSRGW
jgi:hypothetical protein